MWPCSPAADGPENVTLVTPSQDYYAAGSTVNLYCSADSRPATYFWFLDGNQLSDTGPELKLVDIQLNQNGNYSCQVLNNQTLRNETTQPAAVRVLGGCGWDLSLTPSLSKVRENCDKLIQHKKAGSVVLEKPVLPRLGTRYLFYTSLKI